MAHALARGDGRCGGRIDWLVDGLQAAGFKVHLANTTAIKKYEGLKHSGDETDARYLAHLLLAIENIIARQHGARISSNQVKRLTPEAVDRMALPEDIALAVKANVAVIATLCAQIALLEKRLQQKVGARTEYGLCRASAKYWPR